ncbi:amidohydrolase family protein [Colwellia sp. MEBiC06753]
MKIMGYKRICLSLLFIGTHAATMGSVLAQNYDLVINNGRVMDTETQFDGVRNVGILNGKITTITESVIRGKETIDANGLVVAPGFIDTHYHSMDEFATKGALRDGVTYGMDLEAGAFNIDKWYADKKDNWQMNYGVTVSHIMARMQVLDPEVEFNGAVDASNSKRLLNQTAADGVVGWSTVRANAEQLNAIAQSVDEQLRQGALGVGMPLAYAARGVNSYEVFEMQKAAARYGRVASVHTRYHLDTQTPTEAPIAFDEVFTNAMLLGAPLLLAHNNDYGWEENEEKLQMARDKGLNMWSEHYPYIAGSTFVGADFLRPELWLEKYGYRYEDTLYLAEEDIYLSREKYDDLVKKNPGTMVVVFLPPRKDWMPNWLRMPHMTVGSDGMPGASTDGNLLSWDADFSAYAGHPRTVGARAKTLRLARENGVPLMHTLAQLSYWSAKHLGDAGVIAMQKRGRVQEGMVADLTLFNADTVTDHATYKAGQNGLPSTGIPWVVVNGQVVVKNSNVQPNVRAGLPIRYQPEEKGRFEPISAEKWLDTHGIEVSKPPKGKPVVSHLH